MGHFSSLYMLKLICCKNKQIYNRITKVPLETRLEVSSQKSKHMIECRQKNAGQNHNSLIANEPPDKFGKVKILTNNSSKLKLHSRLHKENKSMLKCENTCYYSVQNLLYFRLISKNKMIKV